VRCEVSREALSARFDGEPEPVSPVAVDRHLAACPACRSWFARAERLHRSIQVRPAPPVPDLTSVILERTPAPAGDGWPARLGLAAVAVAQLTLALARLLGIAADRHTHGAGSALGHLAHESEAWNLAIGIGLLWAALRTKAASGQLPVLTGFVVVLTVLSVTDLATGAVTAGRLAPHGLLVVGLVLLLVVQRQRREGDHPHPLGQGEGAFDDARSGPAGVADRAGQGSADRPRRRRPAGRRQAA
jgi:predicted anti-sigma-YlaC factor YlaD